MKKMTRPEDLLQVLQAPSDAFRRSATPLAAEMPVDPQTAPYLVTTTKSLLWHPQDFNGKVRAAMRTDPLDTLYAEIIKEVCTTSTEAKWGSIFPHTLEGVSQAIAYVKDYGIPEVEILSPEASLDPLLADMTKWDGANIVRVKYLPPSTVVVVPKDRDYLGIAMQPGDFDRRLLLVHNPSRGMAVAGWNS